VSDGPPGCGCCGVHCGEEGRGGTETPVAALCIVVVLCCKGLKTPPHDRALGLCCCVLHSWPHGLSSWALKVQRLSLPQNNLCAATGGCCVHTTCLLSPPAVTTLWYPYRATPPRRWRAMCSASCSGWLHTRASMACSHRQNPLTAPCRLWAKRTVLVTR
jgi:hypothetical protein